MRTSYVLTRSIEKRITEDWQAEIPSLGIYEPRHLLRRVGPLLVGVCLDRDSSGEIYKPGFHVHCLGKEAPTVLLTLWTQIRSVRSGGPTYVEVKWHDRQYKEAVARVIRQSLLPLSGDLDLEDVIRAYRGYLSTPLGRRQAALLYRDMVILAAWAGDEEGALLLLNECLRSLGDEASYRNVGGQTSFERECLERIEKPSLIQQTLRSQVEALGVGRLPLAHLRRKEGT